MRFIDILKGIGLMLLTPLVVVLAVIYFMFLLWPITCLVFTTILSISLLSVTLAWVLFGIFIGFVFLIVIIKLLK